MEWIQKELRTAKVIFIVFAVFLLFYVPFIAVQTLITVNGGLKLPNTPFWCTIHKINSLTWLLTHFNCAIDPLISLSLNLEIRLAFLEMFQCSLTCCRDVLRQRAETITEVL